MNQLLDKSERLLVLQTAIMGDSSLQPKQLALASTRTLLVWSLSVSGRKALPFFIVAGKLCRTGWSLILIYAESAEPSGVSLSKRFGIQAMASSSVQKMVQWRCL